MFATTDLHVHLMPYDYFQDRPAKHVGLAQTAALLEEVRHDADNALLFDNGDFLQGTPLSDLIAARRGTGIQRPHPIIDAMNRVGYDAATLGNHEFNYGLGFLDQVLAAARFPVVSANILTFRGAEPAEDRTYRPPWTILSRTMRMMDGGATVPIRVGVIGFGPPQIAVWDRLRLEGQIDTRDIVEAAREHVPAMKAAGADIIVALCHSGIGGALHVPGMENAAVPLAEVHGIDAIVAGHVHRVFPGPSFRESGVIDPAAGTIHGKPAVMPGCFGSHLGIIDLWLATDGIAWEIRGHHVRAEPIMERSEHAAKAVPRVTPDIRVVESAEAAHADTVSFMRQPLARVTGPVNSYFVLAAPNSTIRLVADAQRRFARGLLKGTEHEDRPILSVVAPFKAGGPGGPHNYVDIPAGPLSMRHVAGLYLFPNTLCILEVTGAQVADWLERSAGLFRQIMPGSRGAPLIDPDFAAYNFDILDGLTYRFDISVPPRFTTDGRLLDEAHTRVGEIGLDGRPLDPREKVLLVTNSYRAGGGGLFRAAPRARTVASTAITARDVLVDHIRSTGLIRPDARATWDFVPIPGTTAVLESGPGAVRHMPSNFVHLGPRGDGFEEFEVAL